MKRWLLLLSVLVCGCGADESNARRVLQNQGYTDIQIIGYSDKCGRNGPYGTAFKAKHPCTGKIISGSVCGGIGNGWVISFD